MEKYVIEGGRRLAGIRRGIHKNARLLAHSKKYIHLCNVAHGLFLTIKAFGLWTAATLYI